MTPFVAALLGLAAGLVAGAIVTWLILKGVAARASRTALVSDHVDEVIVNLRAAAAVVNSDDAVVVASPLARGSGLVRGSAIVPKAVREHLAEARASGRTTELEIQLSRGSAIPPVLLGVRVVPLSDGSAVILGEDRSADLRFTETRRDFVANITHELKTPIGAISLLAEAVEAAADDPVAVREFIGKVSSESARLNELVSQIIALSRLQAEDPMLAAQVVSLDEVVEAAIARCAQMAKSRDITVTVGGEHGCEVLGDQSQLEGAVTNLVQNAIAYSEPGARVAVSCQRSPQSGEIEIRVTDNGIGISEADLPRIFERFYRVDYGRSRAHGGTGLGLSIVKHVAAAHGGDVTAWSKPGRGSTFTLKLPDLNRSEGGAA
ncbi:MAG: ATP-binding protein [Propionibacteriaceae bacterium]|nr:ATP-binding protein [Propionibacteriaceae bacterium]